MKVIICGAGQVGYHIARYLSIENNDVTVIDTSPQLIQKIHDSLDVKGVVGFASHPDVLEEADAGDSDMLVAVAASDEVNMTACQVAHSLFNIPKKIARIRARSYLNPVWSSLFSRGHMPIDEIISPEIEVAKAIGQRMRVPGALDMIPIAGDTLRLVGVYCDENCPIINTPLRQLAVLFPDLNIVIVSIVRAGRTIIPNMDDQMLAGDEVYFISETSHVSRAMTAFGQAQDEARRVTILGGGAIGLYLAEELEANHPEITLQVIESEKKRAQYVAQTLERSMILQGDALDPNILEEGNVAKSETVISVTNDDKVNIISSLLVKQMGGARTVTLVNESNYSPMMRSLGGDVVVSPRAITVSTILQHVRRGRIKSVHSLGDELGELIEAEALETSPLVGVPFEKINLPKGVILAAIIRVSENNKILLPRKDTVIMAGDHVVLFSSPDMVKKVEKMLRVRPDFF